MHLFTHQFKRLLDVAMFAVLDFCREDYTMNYRVVNVFCLIFVSLNNERWALKETGDVVLCLI